MVPNVAERLSGCLEVEAGWELEWQSVGLLNKKQNKQLSRYVLIKQRNNMTSFATELCCAQVLLHLNAS